MFAYLGVLVLAAVGGHLLYKIVEWMGTSRPPPLVAKGLARLRSDRVEPSEPVPTILYQLELTRMAKELALVRESDAQGRALRVTAYTIAYDDALVGCCRSVGIDAPAAPRPLTSDQRLSAEASLLAAGVDW